MATFKIVNSKRRPFLDKAVEMRYRERRDKFVAAALAGIMSAADRETTQEEEIAWAIDIGTIAAEALTVIDESADGKPTDKK